MRATDRILKLKKQSLPADKKKIDTSQNGPIPSREQKRAIGKELFPLKINNSTVIYVPKEKCTSIYAAEYRKRTAT